MDLLIMLEGRLHPVEIKLTATPGAGHLQPLGRFISAAGADAARAGLIVCRARRRLELAGGHRALPWQEFPAWLAERLERR